MRINTFEYHGRMTPTEFVEENEDYYTNERVCNNPEKAYKINDGDTEDVYNDMDRGHVIDTMLDCHGEVLEANL